MQYPTDKQTHEDREALGLWLGFSDLAKGACIRTLTELGFPLTFKTLKWYQKQVAIEAPGYKKDVGLK